MSGERPIPYAGSVLAKPDGFNEGVDFALSVIRERIRVWERRRNSGVFDRGLVAIGMVETELVSLKERILAQRRAGT